MPRLLQGVLLAVASAALLLGCTSPDPCGAGTTGGGGEGGGGGTGGALGPITYEDCPKGITKITGQLAGVPIDTSYVTAMAWIDQAFLEPGLDVELADGGGIHVTWVKSEKTWPGPTHIGGSFRLPKTTTPPRYFAVRRDLSGLVTKELDGAKFHLVGNQIDLTGCTKAPATQPN
ncbi:MAG: hypothetical protein ABJE95_20500 [Byssovorax sp.]